MSILKMTEAEREVTAYVSDKDIINALVEAQSNWLDSTYIDNYLTLQEEQIKALRANFVITRRVGGGE